MNTRQKLSWTLLGVALFFGIAAVSTDTTFFKNLSLSGSLKLSGQPEELTVAGGALLFDGNPVGGGGESLWTTNSDGWITPAGGAYLTNTLVFKSGLADNETNVAMVVNTSQAWTQGGASLLSLRNNGANQVAVSPWGGLGIGPNAEHGDLNGPLSSSQSFVAINVPGLGDGDYRSFYQAVIQDTDWVEASEAFINTRVVDETNNFSALGLYAYSEAENGAWDIEAGTASNPNRLRFRGNSGSTLLNYQPKAESGTTPYVHDTGSSHSSGSLGRYLNSGTNKVALNFDGSITAAQAESEPAAPDAGYFTLFATNNAGKMVLKVKFPTGASQVIATEP